MASNSPGVFAPESHTTARRWADVSPFTPMLAQAWSDQDPRGWWLSEKLDGVRAIWNGQQLCSRNGIVFSLPATLKAELPELPLDGELFIGRGCFQQTVGAVRRQDGADADWRHIRFCVFDAPSVDAPFEQRLETLCTAVAGSRFALAHPHSTCTGISHLHSELARIEALGGEGLMLRKPGSAYERRRSPALLKVKTFQDGDAVVLDYTEGQGKYAGLLGALVVQSGGVIFQVGSGLTDADRADPPALGSLIVYRHQGVTDAGIPRFPIYVGARAEGVRHGQ